MTSSLLLLLPSRVCVVLTILVSPLKRFITETDGPDCVCVSECVKLLLSEHIDADAVSFPKKKSLSLLSLLLTKMEMQKHR